jgi:hypothetical protein
MSGAETSADDRIGEVDRAPGQASYDPADVITVYLGAWQSARRRQGQAPAGAAPDSDTQPS